MLFIIWALLQTLITHSVISPLLRPTGNFHISYILTSMFGHDLLQMLIKVCLRLGTLKMPDSVHVYSAHNIRSVTDYL